jgi:hypothetical protein
VKWIIFLSIIVESGIMAWSESFNGRMGPVKDSYHRVAVHLTVTDVDLHPHDMADKMIRLAGLASDSLHIILDLQLGSVSQRSALQLLDEFRNEFSRKWKTYIRASILERCVLTVLYDAPLNKTGVDALFSGGASSSAFELLAIHSIIVTCQDTFQATVEYVNAVFDMISGRSKLGVTLPINDNHMYKLQRIVESVKSDALQIVYFGAVRDPSLLELRKIDFIHSRALNAVVVMPENFLVDLSVPSAPIRSQLLNELSRKYNKFEVSVLAKALLQYGFIVGIGINGATTEEIVWERFLFLCHPFIYRREFVSPTNIMSFTIATEDMDLLTEASEAIECKWDDEILFYATERAGIIDKTDQMGWS